MISFRRSLVLALCVFPIYAGAAFAIPNAHGEKGPIAVGSTTNTAPNELNTIGVSPGDRGIMEPGTVRPPVNYEPLFNKMGILALALGHVLGIYYLIKTAGLTVKTPGKILAGTAKGLTFISIGLLTPGFLHWAYTVASDAALFN